MLINWKSRSSSTKCIGKKLIEQSCRTHLLHTSLAIWSSAWSSADTLVVPRRLPFAPGLSMIISNKSLLLPLNAYHWPLFLLSQLFFYYSTNCIVVKSLRTTSCYFFYKRHKLCQLLKLWISFSPLYTETHELLSLYTFFKIYLYGIIQIWWNEQLLDYLLVYTLGDYKHVHTFAINIFYSLSCIVDLKLPGSYVLLSSHSQLDLSHVVIAARSRRCWNYYTLKWDEIKRRRINYIFSSISVERWWWLTVCI